MQASELPGPVDPPRRLLMGPGPSAIHPRVLEALGRPTVGHLDPYFLRIMDETQRMLRAVFRTSNRMTFAISGTGSAGMEAAVVNVIEPGDAMVVCVNGVFGGRMVDVAERAGAKVTKLERPWGEIFDQSDLRETLERVRPKALGIVMAETSTGAWQPIQPIAELAREFGTLLIVDAVTALGGVEVAVDDWGIDVCYSGTQKCLSCPPGLAPITFSDRALEAVRSRKSKVQSWYLDVGMLANYWGSDRVYHHTAPINMNYALHESLRIVLEEGLENAFARHCLNHEALAAGAAAMGLEFAVPAERRLPMLNPIRIPDGIDDVSLRRELLESFGIEIGAGLGAFKGKVWRVGLMGHAARSENVAAFLNALEKLLTAQGFSLEPGAGISAATEVYRSKGAVASPA